MKHTRELMKIVQDHDFMTNIHAKQQAKLDSKVMEIINDFQANYGEFVTDLAINEILFKGFMEISNDEKAKLNRGNES